MDWRKVTYGKKHSTSVPRKLLDFSQPEIQDGDQTSVPRGRNIPEHKTPTSLPQRNRFALLQTPHRKGTAADFEEEDEDEEDPAHSPKVSPEDRERSPLKPEMAQEVTPRHKAQRPRGEQPQQSTPHPIIYPPHTLIHPSQTPTKPAAAASSVTDPMMNIPATDEPMTQKIFGSYMLSFSYMMKESLTSTVAELRVDMQNLGGMMANFAKETDQRVTTLEKRVKDIAAAHNELVDAHKELMQENKWMREKIADAEDRNRRNNVKLRGVPETVNDLGEYVENMLKATFPDLSKMELEVDRAHRLPKPAHLAQHIPRDVIAKIHFFRTKEKLLAATRGGKKLPDAYNNLTVYQDLSQATLQARREFSSVTTTLRHKNIPYAWGFPPKLIITDNGVSTVIRSPQEGLDLLQKWDIPIVIPRDPRRDRPFRPQDPNKTPASSKPSKADRPVEMDTSKPLPDTEKDKDKGASGGS